MQDAQGQRSRHRILAGLVGLALVAAACTGDDEPGAEPDRGDGAAARNPVTGGELVVGTELEVDTLAPGEAIGAPDALIALGIYDPITTYVDGRIEPFLAESIESNDDLTQYTIELRAGVTFHDGTPLNADAVVKHFDRLKDPATTSCYCAHDLLIIDTMETPDGPEGLTVAFNLGTSSAAFPDLLAGPSGYIESPTAVAGGLDLKTDGVGTGPFMLTDHQYGVRVVLEAYPDYWGTDEDGTQLPYLDKLTVVPIRDSRHVSALETGEIDIFQTADEATIKQAEDAGFAAQKINLSSSTTLLMNNAKPPFEDVRARQAVAYALDKDLLNERIYAGVGEPSYSVFATNSPYFNPDAQTPRYDPDKARELVEELGGLEFTIVCQYGAEADLILDLIKQMGESVGMEITLETEVSGAYVTRIFSQNGDYEAACYRSSHSIEPDAIRSRLTTGDPVNLILYSNEEVDQLLDEARHTADFEERREKYFRVQEITAGEVPLLTTLYDLVANVYDDSRVGPLPEGEPNSFGAIKPGLLHATEG